MQKIKLILSIVAISIAFQWSYAQQAAYSKYYNLSAGSNAPKVAELDDNGNQKKNEKGEVIYKEAAKDHYGNAKGNQYDLAVDGAFEGQTILVLQLYSEESFDFKAPEKALKEKGFGIFRYINNPPDPARLKKDLDQSCQLWIISDSSRSGPLNLVT